MFSERSHNRRWESSPNGLDPARMSAAERLDEVARILALGIIRLRARRYSEKANDPNHLREFGLDFSPRKSVHGLEPAQGREGR